MKYYAGTVNGAGVPIVRFCSTVSVVIYSYHF